MIHTPMFGLFDDNLVDFFLHKKINSNTHFHRLFKQSIEWTNAYDFLS